MPAIDRRTTDDHHSTFHAMLGAAQEKAAALGIAVNIVVLDAGAYLKGFARMEGTVLGSIDVAIRKARTSVLFECNSDAVWDYCKPDAPAHLLELSNGGLTPFAGGILVRNSDGNFVGAIGVSGGAPSQDHAVAEATAKTSTD